MVVKGNQPLLQQDIHLLFQDTYSLAEPMAAAEMVDVGHVRIEPRRLAAQPCSALALIGITPEN
jgi:hypothetical protein